MTINHSWRESAEDRLLSLKETAELLNTPEATLRYWVHLGGEAAPPSARFGRRRMFLESQVIAWRDSHFSPAA